MAAHKDTVGLDASAIEQWGRGGGRGGVVRAGPWRR